MAFKPLATSGDTTKRYLWLAANWGQNFRQWVYVTTDSGSTVAVSGYITDQDFIDAMVTGDFVLVMEVGSISDDREIVDDVAIGGWIDLTLHVVESNDGTTLDLSDDVLSSESPEERGNYNSRADVAADEVAANVGHIRTAGYTTSGDGGGALYDRVLADPTPALSVQSADGAWWELIPDASGLDVKQAGAKGDDSTDNAVALAAFFNAESSSQAVTVSQGTYVTGTALVSEDNLMLLAGKGIGNDVSGNLIGTIIKADDTSVVDLLTIQSENPTSKDATDIRVVKITDLGLFHRGTGAGLLIDNITRCRVENVFIDCNGEGAIGMKLDNWAFFAVIENVNIFDFKTTGLLITGDGTQHIVRSSHIQSTASTAVAALEIRVADFFVDGGQYDVDLSGNGGIGILLNNTGGSNLTGGRISNVLNERDIGIKITGTTMKWDNVIISEPFWNLDVVTTGIFFDQAVNCILFNPHVDSATGAGDLAEWGAGATGCGIVCDDIAAKGKMTVHASATNAWKQVTGRITIAARDLVTTNANLIVTCDDVVDMGKVVHNGTAWDKDLQTVADDIAIAITPPETRGIIEIQTNNAGGEYVLAQYDTTLSSVMMESLVEGSMFDVDDSDGTLANGVGVDGQLTVSADNSSGDIYISNRIGGSRQILTTFRSAQPV